jgi:hypothetical protein
LKKHFTLKEVWESINKKTYYTLLKELPDSTVTGELRAMLDENNQTRIGADELRTKIRDISIENPDFWNQNAEAISRLADALPRNDGEAVRNLYLALLLHIQALQERITPESEKYFTSNILSNVLNADSESEISLKSAYPPRLSANEHGYLYLDKDGFVKTFEHSQKTTPHQKSEPPLVGFSNTAFGFIGIKGDGGLLVKARSELPHTAKNRKIASVSSYGENYILLTEGGDVMTNLRLDKEKWRGLRCVHIGLNTAVGVKSDGALVYEGANRDLRRNIQNYTNIRAAYARGEHFALIDDTDTLITDNETLDGEGVSAAAISALGYAYANDTGVYLWRYGGKPERLATSGGIEELAMSSIYMLYRATDSGGQLMVGQIRI